MGPGVKARLPISLVAVLPFILSCQGPSDPFVTECVKETGLPRELCECLAKMEPAARSRSDGDATARDVPTLVLKGDQECGGRLLEYFSSQQ